MQTLRTTNDMTPDPKPAILTASAALPCPFCGTPPQITSRIDEDLWTHNAVEWKGVRCMDCDVQFDWPPDSQISALDQWNTRATEKTKVVPVRSEDEWHDWYWKNRNAVTLPYPLFPADFIASMKLLGLVAATRDA